MRCAHRVLFRAVSSMGNSSHMTSGISLLCWVPAKCECHWPHCMCHSAACHADGREGFERIT